MSEPNPQIRAPQPLPPSIRLCADLFGIRRQASEAKAARAPGTVPQSAGSL